MNFCTEIVEMSCKESQIRVNEYHYLFWEILLVKCCSENIEVYVTFIKRADRFLGFIYFRHNVIFSFVEIGLGNIILKLTPSPLSGGIFDYVSMVIHNFVIINLK